MDSHYIINRLRSTPYKYPTMAILQTRLSNLDEEKKYEIMASLKKQLYRESNIDIQEQLSSLVYKMPIAS